MLIFFAYFKMQYTCILDKRLPRVTNRCDLLPPFNGLPFFYHILAVMSIDCINSFYSARHDK